MRFPISDQWQPTPFLVSVISFLLSCSDYSQFLDYRRANSCRASLARWALDGHSYICNGCDSGPLFRKSTIPTNPKADPNPITLTLILTLTQTSALWRVSEQKTFEIADLLDSGLVPWMYCG